MRRLAVPALFVLSAFVAGCQSDGVHVTQERIIPSEGGTVSPPVVVLPEFQAQEQCQRRAETQTPGPVLERVNQMVWTTGSSQRVHLVLKVGPGGSWQYSHIVDVECQFVSGVMSGFRTY